MKNAQKTHYHHPLPLFNCGISLLTKGTGFFCLIGKSNKQTDTHKYTSHECGYQLCRQIRRIHSHSPSLPVGGHPNSLSPHSIRPPAAPAAAAPPQSSSRPSTVPLTFDMPLFVVVGSTHLLDSTYPYDASTSRDSTHHTHLFSPFHSHSFFSNHYHRFLPSVRRLCRRSLRQAEYVSDCSPRLVTAHSVPPTVSALALFILSLL